jgi:hypothetical protein
VSTLAAVTTLATILADYLPTELATRVSAAGLPTQTVAAVATGRHISSALAGQVGVWCEDTELTEQNMNGVDYEDVKLVARATVPALDVGQLDAIRLVWADSMIAVVKRRFRVSSPAHFFALRRVEVLDDASSARTPGGIRGVLGAMGVLREPPGLDAITVRFTLGQRTSTPTDVA